jgi:hypothetical protein
MQRWKQQPATNLDARPVQLLPRDLERYRECPGMWHVIEASLCCRAGIREVLEQQDWQAGINALAPGETDLSVLKLQCTMCDHKIRIFCRTGKPC